MIAALPIVVALPRIIKAAKVAAIVGLVGVAGVQSWRVDRLQVQVALKDKALKDAGELLAASEKLRREDRVQASLSYTEHALACEQRINQARAAATAIQDIVKYGYGDAGAHASTTQGAGVARPTRRIVPAAELRRVIGQGAAGAAAGRLPNGSNGAASR